MNNRLTIKENRPDPGDNKPKSEINLYDLSSLLLRRKKLISYTVGTVMVLAAAGLLLIPNHYQSTATILPTGNSDRFSELKSLAGIGNLTGQDENSSDLFPEILQSRQVGENVLDETYRYFDDDNLVESTLAEYFDQDDPDLLLENLRRVTSVHKDSKTGVISIAVDTKTPGLSRAVLQKYLAELEAFNHHKRKSQARDNEHYLARELERSKSELTKAEDSLRLFEMTNRDWNMTSNPEVLTRLGRLKRDVEIKNQAYLYLSQEYEVAKLDAQKDVPIVRLLDRPSLPTQKSWPKRALMLTLITMMTLFFTIAGVVIYEAIRRRAAGDDRQSAEQLKTEIERAFPRTVAAIKGRRESHQVGV